MKCLDTYALVELHNGTPRFSGLLNEDAVIPDIIMAEFYGVLFRKMGLQTADYWLRKLSYLCRPVSRDILIKAVRYRMENQKERLSYFDCVGYIFALENGMKFVTGDPAFQKREGVEWIK